MKKSSANNEFIIKIPDCDFEIDKYGLGNTFFQNMTKYKDRIAQYIADTNEEETYGTLLSKSIRTALKMKSLGITKNDIVSLCSTNHADACIPFIATQFIHGTFANLDPSLSVIDTVHLLNLVKPAMIFVSEEGVDLIEKSLEQTDLQSTLVVFGNTSKYTSFLEFLEPNLSQEAIFKPDYSGNNKDTAIICFSSGTTGLSKGISLSHYSILMNSMHTLSFWKTTNSFNKSVFLTYSGFYWISSTLFLTRAILNGEARVVCRTFNPNEFWNLLDKYKITFTFLSPRFSTDIIKAKPSRSIDLSNFKIYLVSGSAASAELMISLFETFPTTSVVQAYGQTEVGGIITSFRCHSVEDMELQRQKPLSCGKPHAGFWYKIADPETEEILGPNQKGELCLKLKTGMNGYYNMDTSGAYDSDGWLRTGDLVYYDDDKCFYIVDRLKEVLKFQNYHVLPTALENIINTHPDVRESAVIGIPHAPDGEHPMGIILLEDKAKVTENDIIKYVEERVVDRSRLRAGVKFVDQIPKTVTGKIKRRMLRDLVLENKI